MVAQCFDPGGRGCAGSLVPNGARYLAPRTGVTIHHLCPTCGAKSTTRGQCARCRRERDRQRPWQQRRKISSGWAWGRLRALVHQRDRPASSAAEPTASRFTTESRSPRAEPTGSTTSSSAATTTTHTSGPLPPMQRPQTRPDQPGDGASRPGSRTVDHHRRMPHSPHDLGPAPPEPGASNPPRRRIACQLRQGRRNQ